MGADAQACSNCGAPFVPQRRAFCPECGQETHIAPPTLRELAQQFGGAYISTEGALWRTLKLLLTQPGELTVQYLAGRRKHYVLPLRLYLSVSVLVLVLTRFTGGVEVVRGLDRPEFTAAEQGSLPSLVLNASPFSLGIREGRFVCESLPGWLCERARERAAPDTRTLLRKVRQANERLFANLGAVMFVLLPLFAVCLKLVNFHKRLPYTAHLVFALHLHAFWFIVLGLMRLGGPPLWWLGGGAMVAYTWVSGRRVYPGRWLPRLLRAVSLTLLYMGLLGVTVPLAWLVALLA
jgi:hypothetical protein